VPIRPFVEGGLTEGKALGSKEGKAMGSGLFRHYGAEVRS
jgi:hypothetical protein